MEKDYKVTYRSREVDPRDADRYDEPRRRVPTALDPYLHPEDRDELKRNVAEAKARNARYQQDDYRDYEAPVRGQIPRDDVSVGAREPAKPGAKKTTYSVTSAGLMEKASEVSVRAPTTAARTSVPANPAPPVSRYGRRERDDDYETPRSAAAIRITAPPYDDREYQRVERAYEPDRPRREGGARVLDLRDVDVLDVRIGTGAQDADRGFAGYRGDSYSDVSRDTYSRAAPPRDYGYRPSEVEYDDRHDGPYMSGARIERGPPLAAASVPQSSFRDPPPRTSTRVYDEDINTRAPRRADEPPRTSTRYDDDEWGFIERAPAAVAVRDTRAPISSSRDSFRNRNNYPDIPAEIPRDRDRGRARNPPTYRAKDADDEYVMVSPPRDREREARSAAGLRSAMMTEASYTPDERLRRRRSRSISFRDEEARGHERGDGKFVEKPGAEAAMMGKYLKSYDVGGGSDVRGGDERDDYEYAYGAARGRGERDRAYEYEYDYDRRERDRGGARYAPAPAPAPAAPRRARSKSQRRRRRREPEELEDEDGYSSVYQEKTTKTTYY